MRFKIIDHFIGRIEEYVFKLVESVGQPIAHHLGATWIVFENHDFHRHRSQPLLARSVWRLSQRHRRGSIGRKESDCTRLYRESLALQLVRDGKQSGSILELKSPREIRQIGDNAVFDGQVTCVRGRLGAAKHFGMHVWTVGDNMDRAPGVSDVDVHPIGGGRASGSASGVFRMGPSIERRLCFQGRILGRIPA